MLSPRLAVPALVGVAVAVVLLAVPSPVTASCHPTPISPDTPTGIAGCELYGVGTASMWQGPGAARNDCLYPWTDCQPIAIQSLQTGLVIRVTPTQFCDCYTGTSDERIVDLDPSMVAALGLDAADGLFAVRVWPLGGGGQTPATAIPDTAMR